LPAYNEAGNVALMVAKLGPVLARIGEDHFRRRRTVRLRCFDLSAPVCESPGSSLHRKGKSMKRSITAGLLTALLAVSNAAAQTCTGNPVAVQILGSGGPAFNAERASASYLLWVAQQARLLIDIGGGSTELVISDGSRVLLTESLPLGYRLSLRGRAYLRGR